MVKTLEAAPVSVPSLAARAYESARVIDRSLKVATPAAAATNLVPPSTPLPAVSASVIVE